LHLPAAPTSKHSSCPESLLPWLCQRWIFELPRISHPPAVPLMRFRVTPNPALAAGLMMGPRLVRTLHPLAMPRMNLRAQPGLAHSYLILGASSISIRLSTFRTSRACTDYLNWVLHLPARLELRFQFPTGSSTEKESRAVQSVEASGKSGIICGYHQNWCIDQRKLKAMSQFLSMRVATIDADGQSICSEWLQNRESARPFNQPGYFPLSKSWEACVMLSGLPRSRQ
jgi:hypothetical protein